MTKNDRLKILTEILIEIARNSSVFSTEERIKAADTLLKYELQDSLFFLKDFEDGIVG